MNSHNCVVINGRFLEQKLTGVQRFAFESIKSIDNLLSESENSTDFILAIPSDVDTGKLPAFKKIKVEKTGSRHGILWAQTDLARFIKKHHALGLHLCNAVPFSQPGGIVCIHDISYKIHPEFVTTKKHQIIRWWHLVQNHVSIKKSLAILTVSQTSKDEICEVYRVPSDKVNVVYNGWQHFNTSIPSDCTMDRFPELKGRDFFYSMSSLGKNKNFCWIIEEARLNPDKIFAIAGNNDLKKYGDTFAGQALPNVHYLGYVSDAEAKLLMKNCRAFIFPSIYEGFGIPPLEALAMGSKVICSNASCLPEIFMDCVHYINPFEHNADLESLLLQAVAPASKVLEKYSWRNTAEKILNVIKENI